MNKHRIGALIAAAALTLTFAGTSLAVTYATVDGYEANSSAANNPDNWESGDLVCDKIDDLSIDSWETDADYALVVVKAGAGNVDPYTNTIFENTSKGEVVWADTNGNGTFDPGGQGGDKQISHIIVCNPEQTTTTTTTTTTTESTETETTDTSTTTTTTTTESTDTETTDTTTSDTTSSETTSEETTPEGSVEELTPPSTDTIGQPTSSSSVSTGLLLVLAGILATVLVVVPAAARNRR
jgi:hypothetical protein